MSCVVLRATANNYIKNINAWLSSHTDLGPFMPPKKLLQRERLRQATKQGKKYFIVN